MATKFLEPGGDADFLVGTTNGFWFGVLGSSGFPAVATDFVHGTHQRSIKFAPTTTTVAYTNTGILADAGSRISVYLYINALPSSTVNFLGSFNSALESSVFSLALTSGGVLQLKQGDSFVQIGSNGATLSTGQWYRISLAYTITSTSVNRFEVFVNGVSSISVTNASLSFTGSSSFYIGIYFGNSTFDIRTSDHYIDDSSSLTDTGNIWVTAKRPVSNGTAVEFTTQIGSGGSGYGSGHTPQVNERPLDTADGWSISTTTRKTEEYTIEAKSVGDINISSATIVDYMGWVSANVDSTANSPVHRIIVAGATTAKTLSTTARIYTQIAGSSTYPTGNTDIGIDAQYTTTPHLTRLFECGVIVAFIPGPTTSIKTFLGNPYASTKTVDNLALASVKTWEGLA